jgi:hypothetical protein
MVYARSAPLSVPALERTRGKCGSSMGDVHVEGCGNGSGDDEGEDGFVLSKSVDDIRGSPHHQQQQRWLSGGMLPATSVAVVPLEEKEDTSQGSSRRRRTTLNGERSPTPVRSVSESVDLGYADEGADEGDGSRRKRDALKGLVRAFDRQELLVVCARVRVSDQYLITRYTRTHAYQMKKSIKPLGRTASLVGSKIINRSPLRTSNAGQGNGDSGGYDTRNSTGDIICRNLYDDVVLFGDDAGDALDASTPPLLSSEERELRSRGGSMDDITTVGLIGSNSDSEVSHAMLGTSFSPVPSPPSYMSTPCSPATLRRSAPVDATCGSPPPSPSTFHPSYSTSPPGYSGTCVLDVCGDCAHCVCVCARVSAID